MHRIASIPGEETTEDITLVQQPEAPVLLLTSARTDISTLAAALDYKANAKWKNRIRALPLEYLNHQAKIDHYLTTTAESSRIILIRLLGGKGHWSYGLDQLKKWQEKNNSRKLIVISGTKEHELELNELSNIELDVTFKIGELFRLGGTENINTVLKILGLILNKKEIDPSKIAFKKPADPTKWDWQDEQGPKVGIIYYLSTLQSGNQEIAVEINKSLRKNNLVPRVLWVTSLKKLRVQQEILKIFKQERVSCILTATAFASVKFSEVYEGKLIWDEINKPLLQLLTSTRSQEEWKSSHRGLSPLDFSLQIVLPELDGKINTRIVAFREFESVNKDLYSKIEKYKPYKSGISWLIKYIKSTIDLYYLNNNEKKIAIVLANYPIKDGRIANGVGLDTPLSLVKTMSWLKQNGYTLNENNIPKNSKELIKQILSKRTNSNESLQKAPLDYLSLEDYLGWWGTLTLYSRKKVIEKWGEPIASKDLEKNGFPIHGIKNGNVCILIQQSRGHDFDNINDIHSPDLPPSHNYLAQYLWISLRFNANCIIHFGKHGTLEWLPGKSIGLSDDCFPQIALPPLPNIYPFIVNDPGEGSQAKRRTQAIIIDHLTPPLGRAGLYGELSKIEALIDEYHEATMFSSDRVMDIKLKLKALIKDNNINYEGLCRLDKKIQEVTFEDSLSEVEAYLCELKEAQIRTGLHVFGQELNPYKVIELALSISLAPSFERLGLSQSLSDFLDLELDPWTDNESEILVQSDIDKLSFYYDKKLRIKGDGIAALNLISYNIIATIYQETYGLESILNENSPINNLIRNFLDEKSNHSLILYVKDKVLKRIVDSPSKEKGSLLDALAGKRIEAGPSGAPTRGKPEVLPTGRNFFSVDLRSLPTESAWDLGKRSAQKILDLYLLEYGENLSHLALSIWGTSTMRNGGEEIGQIFALMGVKPIWDYVSRRVVDIEIIPCSVLGRPRVDVTVRISGLFRDAFPNLIDLITRATAIVGELDEPEEFNPLASSIRNGGAKDRVFGSAPETYGTGLQELINLGNWEEQEDLAKVYMDWSKWVYKDSETQVASKSSLIECLERVQVVLHSQDNREHDLLDSDDYYQFHGGLSSAVEKLSNKKPNLYFADNSKYSKPKVHTLNKEIDKVVRSRLLNPKWIKGMMNHGYKGAFEMSASLDYLFAYDATTKCVPNWCYKEIANRWLFDKSIEKFLIKENPWVLRDMSERLLEAVNRGLWNNINNTESNKLKGLITRSERLIEDDQF
ncbi:cobaltochelatase subunit CobN [Prochlorococcus marinus]|uniref:Cobalamin biosynthetic protein CobN n=1 Tax=Prochlorococcus marinus (strain MIT 9211) TaxID=93059 RepID=A9BAF4_PROM4|nr:cobaltochelatase subunit CobN [Prochlorococcus marinus]ABX08816.1 cobalamin biosynthetic protein CobN [Prochlorococcus marinus str. MIT 9211]